MNKRWKIVGIAVVALALLLGSALTVAAEGPRGGMGRLGGIMDRMGAIGRAGPGQVANSEAIAKALGLTADELRAQLRDGATLADLAEAKGVDLQTLRDLATGERKANILERLGQALENGKITEAFSNWFKKGVDAGYVLGFDGRQIDNPTIQAVAKALNMKAEDVELQMWGGRTLADLAKKAGVELTAVQQAVAQAQKDAAIARIQQMVKDGRITQDRADWMIEGINSGFQGMERFGALGRFGGQAFGRGEMPMMRGRMPMTGGRRAFGQGQNGASAGSPNCQCTETTPTN